MNNTEYQILEMKNNYDKTCRFIIAKKEPICDMRGENYYETYYVSSNAIRGENIVTYNKLLNQSFKFNTYDEAYEFLGKNILSKDYSLKVVWSTHTKNETLS
jgi:hypothetical protein